MPLVNLAAGVHDNAVTSIKFSLILVKVSEFSSTHTLHMIILNTCSLQTCKNMMQHIFCFIPDARSAMKKPPTLSIIILLWPTQVQLRKWTWTLAGGQCAAEEAMNPLTWALISNQRWGENMRRAKLPAEHNNQVMQPHVQCNGERIMLKHPLKACSQVIICLVK